MSHEYFEFKCSHCQKSDWRKDNFDLPCRACGEEVMRVPGAIKVFGRDDDRWPSDNVMVYCSPTKEPPYTRLHTSSSTDTELPPDDAA